MKARVRPVTPWAWSLGRVAGIEIRLHATLYILFAWIGASHLVAERTLAAAARAALAVVVLFAVVVLHELGHALVARRYGVTTRAIALLPIGGVAHMDQIQKEPRQELFIALAGPAVILALAACAFAGATAVAALTTPNIEVAMSLAEKFDAKITLMHATWLPASAYAGHLYPIVWPLEDLERDAKKALERLLAKVRLRFPKAEAIYTMGEPWEQILHNGKGQGADLIVMGTHGRRGLAHLFLGSVAEKVERLSPIPVLTVSAAADRDAKDKAAPAAIASRGETVIRAHGGPSRPVLPLMRPSPFERQ